MNGTLMPQKNFREKTHDYPITLLAIFGVTTLVLAGAVSARK